MATIGDVDGRSKCGKATEFSVPFHQDEAAVSCATFNSIVHENIALEDSMNTQAQRANASANVGSCQGIV